MKKLQPFVALLFAAVLLLSVVAFAHPGNTDSKGGHHDGSSYHYHHGYPPHQHINGCPYDFDDQTRHGSSAFPIKEKDKSTSDGSPFPIGVQILLGILFVYAMAYVTIVFLADFKNILFYFLFLLIVLLLFSFWKHLIVILLVGTIIFSVIKSFKKKD